MSESLELFIRIDENGNTVNHPIFGDNFRQAFPDIDVDNLPANFARFVRVQRPDLSSTPYRTLESETSVYTKVDGVWTDVWSVRNMTAEEKAAKQQQVRDSFNSRPQAENWSAWTLDEETCKMVPPVPKPAESRVMWQGSTSSWAEYPDYPNDDKLYRFDFFTWQWVEAPPAP